MSFMHAKPAMFALLAGLLACGEATPSKPAARAKIVAAPGEVPAPSAAPGVDEPVELVEIPGGAAPGAAYFVINTQGVARLDATGVALILAKPDRNIQDLFVGPDGAVYLLDARSLRKLDNEAFVEVLRFEFEDIAPVEALALAPDGAIWATSSRGVGRYADGAWTISTREQLGLGYSSDVAIGFDGDAWLAGTRKLLRRPAGATDWSLVETAALGRAGLILHPSASPAGFVAATNGEQLIRLRGGALELTPIAPDAQIGFRAELSIAADGTIALASGTCELARFGPDGRGEPWRLGRDSYACETLEAMAIDARARIWVASREGLSVIDRQGLAVEYPGGSFAALAGRVSQIAVVGLGPELPPVPEPATATLIGKILVEGEPLARAKIEACPTVRLVEQGSPCAGAKRRYAGTTDGRGGFRLEDVAIGDYSVAIEVDGRWRWTSPPSFAAQLRRGEVHDLGALALAKLRG